MREEGDARPSWLFETSQRDAEDRARRSPQRLRAGWIRAAGRKRDRGAERVGRAQDRSEVARIADAPERERHRARPRAAATRAGRAPSRGADAPSSRSSPAARARRPRRRGRPRRDRRPHRRPPARDPRPRTTNSPSCSRWRRDSSSRCISRSFGLDAEVITAPTAAMRRGSRRGPRTRARRPASRRSAGPSSPPRSRGLPVEMNASGRVPPGVLEHRAHARATLVADVAERRGLEDDRQPVRRLRREHARAAPLDVVALDELGRIAANAPRSPGRAAASARPGRPRRTSAASRAPSSLVTSIGARSIPIRPRTLGSSSSSRRERAAAPRPRSSSTASSRPHSPAS